MPDQPLLEIRNLAVSIGGRSALTDVNLTTTAGSRVGIVGETGSGKSLTMRAVTGLLANIDARTVGGSVTFDGIDLTRATRRDWQRLRGHRIAFVPQSSMSGLDPLMTVGAQLVETIRVLTDERAPSAVAVRLLEQVRISDPGKVLGQRPHELSGGMRQRVMIALAMVGEPELIIADEPTTALDVTVQRGILELLRGVVDEAGASLVLISHDLDVVRSIATEVTIMYAGMTVESGLTAQVLSRPTHPYTKALIDSSPSGVPAGQLLSSISGVPPGLGHRPTGCPFEPRCKYSVPECSEPLPPAREVLDGQISACVRAEEMDVLWA